MKRRVFFLGAGFSKLAGLPVMVNFYNFLVESKDKVKKLSPTDVTHVGFEQCCKKIKNLNIKINKMSFSDFFSLTGSLASASLASVRPDLRDTLHYTCAMSYIFAMSYIAKCLLIAQDDVIKYVKAHIDSCDNKYRRFYSLLGNGDNEDSIITTNYDYLSELFLWKLNKWSFLDGYGEKFSEEEFGIRCPSDRKCSKIKIYKTNGSINWSVIDGEITLRDSAHLFDLDGNNLSARALKDWSTMIQAIDYEKAILLPVCNQDLCRKNFLFKIWDKAFEEMKLADEVFFIGFSFGIFDNYLLFMIRESMSDGKKIYNVNPDARSSDRLEKIIGDKIKPIHKKFEEWDMAEMSE